MHRFRRRFQSKKSELFPPRELFAHADGVPLGIGYRVGARVQKQERWGYQKVKFKTGLAVFIYRHNTGV